MTAPAAPAHDRPPRNSRGRRLRAALSGPGPNRMQVLNSDGTASAVDHLEELRWRIVAVAFWLVIAFGVAYYYKHDLITILDRPLGGKYHPITLGVTEPFFTILTICANAAFIAIMPITVFNLWRYIAPALSAQQRRAARPVLLATPALFFTGVVFCYYFVLTPALQFLLGFGHEDFNVTVRAKDYYSFAAMTLLAMGIVFLFPLLLLGLARLGIVTADLLRRKRRLGYVLIVIGAALLPTVDPVSLLIETLPLAVLFELSIVPVALQERATRRRTADATGSDGASERQLDDDAAPSA
ncbi:MAG: twin-arginine translocase subunit TatC [Thermoleophilia bacterium]|nr:twin-arginine translocase subunit TatC [Thermoleophilia bacterium]